MILLFMGTLCTFRRFRRGEAPLKIKRNKALVDSSPQEAQYSSKQRVEIPQPQRQNQETVRQAAEPIKLPLPPTLCINYKHTTRHTWFKFNSTKITWLKGVSLTQWCPHPSCSKAWELHSPMSLVITFWSHKENSEVPLASVLRPELLPHLSYWKLSYRNFHAILKTS